MSEIGIVVGVAAAAAVYLMAARRRHPDRRQREAAEGIVFVLGLVVVAVALLPPMDGFADSWLWVHMVQHILLISLAAPLLALGRPFAVLAAAWPRAVAPIPRPGAWAIVVAASTAQVVTLLLWHLPALYDAAVSHDVIHAVEHLSLLFTAVAMWAALEALQGEEAGLAVLALFILSFPMLLLGAAMTFAKTPWYPAYQQVGHNVLADQQLAGVVMWAYGGLAAVVGGIVVFARWLQRLELASPGAISIEPPDVPSTGIPRC